MTAAERKVREKYPEAHAFKHLDGFWRVWKEPLGPEVVPCMLSVCGDLGAAWEHAASRLPTEEDVGT